MQLTILTTLLAGASSFATMGGGCVDKDQLLGGIVPEGVTCALMSKGIKNVGDLNQYQDDRRR